MNHLRDNSRAQFVTFQLVILQDKCKIPTAIHVGEHFEKEEELY